MRLRKILSGFLAAAITAAALPSAAAGAEDEGLAGLPAETAEGDIVIDESTFPDPVFRQYVKDNLDAGRDGKMSRLELSMIQTVNVVGCKEITSLKGIELFSGLRTLTCSENKITSLDLSSNPALEKVWACDNKLTSVDVSKCTALKSLGVHNNELTSIDVSNNTELEIFWCKSNKLTSIDISKNTKLEEFTCAFNQITSIDVSNNTALWDLVCANNKLTKVDVSKNTKLTSFSCSANKLTELDVSKNTELEDLDCDENLLTSLDISNNLKLKRLSCHTNKLTALDISKNTALTYLHCGGNLLTRLDVSNNPELTFINCKENKLSSLDISKCVKLKSLYCQENGITVLDTGKNPELSSMMTDGNITIYGIAGLYPETYAKSNNIKFIAGEAPAPGAALPKPETVKSTAGAGEVTVVCSKVAGAKNYKLFYTTDNGKNYTKVGDSKTRKWVVSSLKANVEYKFLVLTYNGEKWSSYKKGECFAAATPSIAKPAAVKATAGVKKAVVTCSTVKGAKKYRLFYTTDNGKSYKKVGDNTTRKWTVTGLKSGATYKFLVLAYDGKGWSKYTKGECTAAVVIK